MSEENRKTGKDNKILSFQIKEEDLQDPEMDRFVRESLIREADELEREINSKPELAGIEAPEGLFDSIVAELKARGVWEEDEGDAEHTGDMVEVADGAKHVGDVVGHADGAEHVGDMVEVADGAGHVSDVMESVDGSQETPKPLEMPEVARGHVDGAEQMSGMAEHAGDMVEVADGTKHVGDVVERVNGVEHTGGMPGSAGNVEVTGIEESEEAENTAAVERESEPEKAADDLEAIYAQLSEEDQKALELGRQMVQRREAKAGKRRRRRKFLKVSGIAAACLGVIFALSMTSAANRRLVKRMWDGLTKDFVFKMDTNYVGDEETVRSKSKEEVEAMETIRKETGAPVIDFCYLPKGMKYQGYEIAKRFETVLFYSYQDTIFSVTIIDVDKEGSYYYMYDGEAVLRETIVNKTNIEAKIWEVNLDIKEETYVAEMEHGGWRYVLEGMLPFEEMKKIVEYLIIL